MPKTGNGMTREEKEEMLEKAFETADTIDGLGTTLTSTRFFGGVDSAMDKFYNNEFSGFQNTTMIGALNRDQSRNNVARIYMMSDPKFGSPTLKDTLSDVDTNREFQFDAGMDFEAMLKHNPIVDSKLKMLPDAGQKLKLFGEIYAKGSLRLCDEKMPAIDYKDAKSVADNFTYISTLGSAAMDWFQAFDKFKVYPEFMEGFNTAAAPYGFKELSNGVSDVAKYARMVEIAYKPKIDSLAERAASKLLLNKYSREFAGKTVQEVTGINNEYLTAELIQLAPKLDSIYGDDKSKEYKEMEAFVYDDAPFSFDLKKFDDTEIREAMTFTTHMAIPESTKAKLPPFESAAEAKKIMDLSKGRYTAEQIKSAGALFDTMFTKNADLNLNKQLDDPIYESMSENGKTQGTDLFFIDGVNIQDIMAQKYENYATKTPEEKDSLKKTEIMAAVTSGQKHVEIGSVILNGNNQYEPVTTEIKIDLTALNGFEGRFSKNREELERNLAASDTGRQQRLRGIQASVGARIMNAEMKKVNQKAKADYDAKKAAEFKARQNAEARENAEWKDISGKFDSMRKETTMPFDLNRDDIAESFVPIPASDAEEKIGAGKSIFEKPSNEKENIANRMQERLTALSKDGILSAEFTRGGLGGFRTLSQLVYLHDAHAKFSDLTDTGFDKDKKLAASERVLSALEKMNDQRHGKDTEGYDKMAAVLADAVNGANSIDIITESQRMVLPQADLSKDPAEFDAKKSQALDACIGSYGSFMVKAKQIMTMPFSSHYVSILTGKPTKKEEKVEDFELKVYEKARKKAGLTELAKYSDLMNVAYSPASEFKNVSAKLLVSKPTDADITLGKIFDQKALQLQMMSGTGLLDRTPKDEEEVRRFELAGFKAIGNMDEKGKLRLATEGIGPDLTKKIKAIMPSIPQAEVASKIPQSVLDEVYKASRPVKLVKDEDYCLITSKDDFMPAKIDMKYGAKEFFSHNTASDLRKNVYADSFFDKMFGDNEAFKVALLHPLYKEIKGASISQTDVFFIDGKSAEEFTMEKSKTYAGLKSAYDKENYLKKEIVTAMMSGHHHVEIGTFKLNDQNDYEPEVVEVKADFKQLDSFGTIFDKSREKEAQKFYAKDTPVTRDARHKLITDRYNNLIHTYIDKREKADAKAAAEIAKYQAQMKGKEEKKAANAATREKIGFSGLEDEAVKNGEKAIRQSKREKDAKQVQTKKAEVKKAEVKKAEIKKPEIKPAAKGMI